MDWLKYLNERQALEVKWSQHYVSHYKHGTSGHLGYTTLATVATILDELISKLETEVDIQSIVEEIIEDI